MAFVGWAEGWSGGGEGEIWGRVVKGAGGEGGGLEGLETEWGILASLEF